MFGNSFRISNKEEETRLTTEIPLLPSANGRHGSQISTASHFLGWGLRGEIEFGFLGIVFQWMK